MGESFYKLESRKSMKMKGVLYVPCWKKNLISISSLDKKVFIVSFVDGEVLMWSRGNTIDDVVVIGVEEGGLYKLMGPLDSTLKTSTIIQCELWDRIISHVNYKELPIISKIVIGLPEREEEGGSNDKGR